MLNQEQQHIPDQYHKGGRRYLPEMTALFIEGLTHETQNRQMHGVLPNFLSGGRTLRQGKVRKPAAAGEIAPSAPPAIETLLPVGDAESSDTKTAQNEKLLIFIRGLSNGFNDIFMGIWGNVSLIYMDRHASESVRKGIRQIERLIHHGSVLIHLVFGYLAENRMAVKHIRLNQLLQQINAASLSNDGALNSKTNKSGMLWVSSLSHPARLSRSLSRFFEKLLCWIETEHRLVLAQTAADDAVRARLLKIDALIKRGFALTEQLKQYAGDTPLVMRRMRMKSLIKHTLKQFELSRHGICLETDLSVPLPDIPADRAQLSNVLKHLITNAIDAMPKGGRLTIAAQLMSKERSREKLVMRSGGIDYLVVAVSDSGKGMPSQVQSRIFDPFYVEGRKPDRLGLGLSVASAIVKAHDGYIQVSSHQGKGSTFRVYLPLPVGQNLLGHSAGRAHYIRHSSYPCRNAA